MSKSRSLDIALGMSFAALGAALGGWITWQHPHWINFYQIFMPELVHAACGQGSVHHDIQPKVLLDFLTLRTVSFDCSALTPPNPALPENIFLKAHLYLARLIDFVWQHSSIQYRNLWPVAAVLAGSYAGGVFVLLRLFFERWFSAAGAAVLTISPIHLGMVLFIRDYSKAPFFVWGLVFLIAVTRARTFSSAVLWAALAGVVTGTGYGFRQDVIIMLPVGILLIAATWSKSRWRQHGAAALAFGTLTLALASPMLTLGNTGGFGSSLMQGLTEPYRRYLALGEAPYSLGNRYSDELTLSGIAADLSVADPKWEAQELQPWAGMSQSTTRSGPYVLRWLPLFSGDVATQSIKSALWILGLPAIVAPSRVSVDWSVPGVFPPIQSRPGAYAYSWIAKRWLPWVGLAGFIVFLWQVWSVQRREALALGLVLSGLLSYSFVQFALRHVFHLEFIWVAAVLSLFRVPFQFPAMAKNALSFLLMVGLVSAVVLGTRAGLSVYQDHALRKAFEALLEQPRETVTFSKEPAKEGHVLLRVPVPDRAKSLLEGPPDSMDNTMGQRGTQSRVAAMVDRWLISIESAACTGQQLTLIARYQKRPTVWQPLDQAISLDVAPGTTQVLVPAFYRATQHLPGITLPESMAGCVSRIERITGTTPLPSVLSAVFSPGWQNRPLHRDLGGFPLAPTVSVAPAWN